MEKIDLLLDTDAGGDCDDMLALAYLIYARRNLGVNIRSVTHSQGCQNGTAMMRMFFRDRNEPVPPLGKIVAPVRTYDYYCKDLVARFAQPEDYQDDPAAVIYADKKPDPGRYALSSLHYEPQDQVRWQMIFRRKICKDLQLQLLP